MTGKEDKAKKRKAKSRVYPSSTDNEGDLLEVDEKKFKNNRSIATKFRIEGMDKNKLNVISNIKAGTAKWRKYITLKRKTVDTDGDAGFDRRKTGGIGLTFDIEGVDVCDASLSSTQRHMIVAHNRNLIEYFARLALASDDNDNINLEYVETVLQNGADIDCTDKFGQSIFHEAARTWHLDVAKFLLDHGANLDQPDNYGRTPLHVAAAVDYPDMVKFLIANGANKEARTKGELQTPAHFAARNDACLSLKALIKCGCNYKEVRDYKGRTPLHVAAELDRSETARLLLELDDPALAGVEDLSGQTAIAWMITKMPTVAKIALDQFHTTDRANRKQYYYLSRLDPMKPDDDRAVHPQTAHQVIVDFRRYELVVHAVFLELINVKWNVFARYRAVFNSLLNLIFILLWSAFGIVVEYNVRHDYKLPEQWWRIVLLACAVIVTGWQIIEELREFILSRRHHNNWKDWRESEVSKDIKFCHPRWPEEEKYLKQEIDNLDDVNPQYFSDFWNIFDWIVYTMLLVSLITHIIDVAAHSTFRARLHVRIMAITIILLWLRLMKNLRAFAKMGPFIVMLGHMTDDVFKFFILYMQFFIPFACAFWMIFGGTRIPEDALSFPNASDFSMNVAGLGTAGSLMFSLFRLTLVDDYDFDGMKQVDSIMCYILVGMWLALSAILMLNLFIALLSDTFQRVYDNAKANAVMQKAIAILTIEERLSHNQRMKFRTYLHAKCAPEEDFYDDDATEVGEEDLKKVTFQIKDKLEELEEALKGEVGEEENGSEASLHQSLTSRKLVSMGHFEKTITSLQHEVKGVYDQQVTMAGRFHRDLNNIKSLLKEMISQQQQPVHTDLVNLDVHAETPLNNQRYQSPRNAGTTVDLEQGLRPSGPAFDRSTTGHTRMDSELDDEWRKSEKKRNDDLDKLRQQLAHKSKKKLTRLNSLPPTGFRPSPPDVPIIEVSNLSPSSSSSSSSSSPSSHEV